MLLSLVFPNGEHPQALLREGVNGIGSAIDNEFVLHTPAMPAVAAMIHVMGAYAHVSPAKETDVFINGLQIFGSVSLGDGDRLLISGIEAHAVLPDEDAREQAVLARRDTDPVPRTCRSATDYLLHGLTGVVSGRLYALPRTVIVGRAADCDFTFPMDDLSRWHAALKPSVSGVLVEDLASRNGVYINDRRVQEGILLVGDELRLASHRFRVCAPQVPGRAQVDSICNRGSAR